MRPGKQHARCLSHSEQEVLALARWPYVVRIMHTDIVPVSPNAVRNSPRSPAYILSTHRVSGIMLTVAYMLSFSPPGSLWWSLAMSILQVRTLSSGKGSSLPQSTEPWVAVITRKWKIHMPSPFDWAVYFPTGKPTPVQNDKCSMLFVAVWFVITEGCNQPECPSRAGELDESWNLHIIGRLVEIRMEELSTMIWKDMQFWRKAGYGTMCDIKNGVCIHLYLLVCAWNSTAIKK